MELDVGSSWSRAGRDTRDTILSSVRFWFAQLLAAAVSSVYAVGWYPVGSSSLTQARIQAFCVLIGFMLLGGVVLGVNWLAASPRRQRNEARVAIIEKDQVIHELSTNVVGRTDLIAARDRIGNLMGDMGEHIGSIYRDENWARTGHEYFADVLEFLRGPNPTFDESHVGRFYAATTRAAWDEVEGHLEDNQRVERVLHAQIDCLDRFITEINDVLHARHGIV